MPSNQDKQQSSPLQQLVRSDSDSEDNPGLEPNPLLWEEDIIREAQVSFFQGMLRIGRLTLPMMISFSMSFIMLAVAIYSGHLNDDADQDAATTLMTAVANSVSAIVFGPLFAVGILTAKKFGELQKAIETQDQGEMERLQEEMSHLNKNGIYLSLMAAPIPTSIMLFSSDILQTLGQSATVANIAQKFLRPFAAAMPAWGWRVVNEQVCFALSRQKLVGAVCIGNFALTCALAGLFAFGVGALPKMGLPGIAWGFDIEAYLTPLMLTGYLMYQKMVPLFGHWRLNWQRDSGQLREILKIALPMLLSFANEFGAQLAMNTLMGVVGRDALAAQNFMSQFYFLVYFPLITFGVATSQEFGRMIGARRFRDAQTYARSGLCSVSIVVGAMSITFGVYPQFMTYLLVNNSSSSASWESLLVQLAPIYAGLVVLDSCGFNMLQVLRTGGDNLISSLISSITLWSGIGAGSLMTFKGNMGPRGITIGYAIGLALRAGLLSMRWRKMIKPETQQRLKNNDPSLCFNRGFWHSLSLQDARSVSRPTLRNPLLIEEVADGDDEQTHALSTA